MRPWPDADNVNNSANICGNLSAIDGLDWANASPDRSPDGMHRLRRGLVVDQGDIQQDSSEQHHRRPFGACGPSAPSLGSLGCIVTGVAHRCSRRPPPWAVVPMAAPDGFSA